MKKEEVTKLGIVDSGSVDIDHNTVFVNVTDYGVFVETDYLEEEHFLISEDKIKKLDTLELNIITEKLFLRHLERNIKILNGVHRELENILYSESRWFTPKNFINLNLSNTMTQYFNEAYDLKNIVDHKKPKFTEHFILLYKKYPSSFVNSHPKNERKEITDYLLNPINITENKEKIKDKNFEINQGIIIDKDKDYLMGKSLFFNKFSEFLSKKRKGRHKMAYCVLKQLNRDMPILTRLAMKDCQEHLEESRKMQEEARKKFGKVVVGGDCDGIPVD